MSIIVDGHNLIPKIRGMSLTDLNDEMQLIELLQVYCRVKRRKIEVYFDGAPAGNTGIRRFGSVTAVFVRKGIQADERDNREIGEIGKKARNWRIVTSDRKIQAQARALYVNVIQSEIFAEELEKAQGDLFAEPTAQPDNKLSQQEIVEWLKIFDEDEGGE